MKKLLLLLSVTFFITYTALSDDEPTRSNPVIGHKVEKFKLLTVAQWSSAATDPEKYDVLEIDYINHSAKLVDVEHSSRIPGGYRRTNEREYSLGDWMQMRNNSFRVSSEKLLNGNKKYRSLILSDVRKSIPKSNVDVVVHEFVKKGKKAEANTYYGLEIEDHMGMPNPATVNCDKLEGKLQLLTDKVENKTGFCSLGASFDSALIEEWTLYRATVGQEQTLATEKYLAHPMVKFGPIPHGLPYDLEYYTRKYCETPIVGGKIEEMKIHIIPTEKAEPILICRFSDNSAISAETLQSGPDAEPNVGLTKILKDAKE
ncbi:MAG: DUF333 domain-containing protein [Bdellovibrio sp.]|nr:DUF333 domain-containing protein [Bdellovibrio sp.]